MQAWLMKEGVSQTPVAAEVGAWVCCASSGSEVVVVGGGGGGDARETRESA